MNILKKLTFSLLITLTLAQTALAVPPPDFLFNLGSSLFQAFSLILIFFSAILISIKQYAKIYISHLKHKKILFTAITIFIISTSAIGAYLYDNYQQKEAYEKWLAESKKHNPETNAIATKIDKLEATKKEQPKSQEDPHISFIREYYKNIADGKIQSAYAVSKKTVDFNTYKNWYKNVTALEIKDIQKIDKNNYSIQLKITETKQSTNYKVLMQLKENKEGIQIASSTVTILSTNSKSKQKNKTQTTSQHQKQNLEITNTEFNKIIKNNSNIFVLDAREDEEYEIGQFPNSTHIRFADLLEGQWTALPKNKQIYVLCWSGIRGKETAEFLHNKNLSAQYLKDGANGWVKYGGKWNGHIKFSQAHPEERFKKIVSLSEIKTTTATIVDSRTKQKYNAWHIPNSINIPTIYTPSSQIEATLNQVPNGASIITVCDDFVSCFDAKITGLKLERKGHQFIGRFNKPWTYKSSQ